MVGNRESRRTPATKAPAAAAVARPGDPPRSEAAPWQFDTRRSPARPAVPAKLDEVARSYLGLCSRKGVPDGVEIDRWRGALGEGTAASLFRDLHAADPHEADRVARGLTSLPSPGDDFLGFRLVEELGRGAFGRVYLAQQGELADRPVALKVSAELAGESQTLAQLQHTNIVPIFSVHRAGPLQAVCMPYYGMTTLKDVYDDLEASETAPASGRTLVANLSSRRPGSGSARSSTRRPPTTRQAVAPAPAPAPAVAPAVVDPASLPAPLPATEVSHVALSNTIRMIGEMPYDRAVLWLGSRLADALAHAHERGILHRDLKPANILLTDDGQPMILDFNLAEDSRAAGQASAASIGGTLPYMAPEHLAAFRGDATTIDARSDLYALGIILYELLTRAHPFPIHDDATPDRIARMIADRQGSPPSIRTLNPRVTPAAESIVRHCLEPDPARRYQSARELRDDLERQLADRPLRHAPEPSALERGAKFARRHPRFGAWVGIIVSATVLFGVAAALAARSKRVAGLEASAALSAFQEDADASRSILSTRSEDRSWREAGDRLGREALGRYRVLEDPAWMRSPLVANLPEGDRQRLRPLVGEALMLLADVAALDAADRPEPAGRLRAAKAGLDLQGLALACFEGEPAPPSLLKQRAALMVAAGRPEDARAAMELARAARPATPRDFAMDATDHAIRGEYALAIPLAEKAARLDPRSFWAWFTLGVCYDRTERPGLAVSCFNTCVALRPDFHHSWFNRGLCHLRAGRADQSAADFDRAIALKPDWYEPYLNRALARRDLGDFRAAAEDLGLALDRGATESRVYFLRAEARSRAGDAAGAAEDRRVGLTKAPTDAASYIARATQRMADDPAGALADFEKASELDPGELQALHMRAHILAVNLGRLDGASPILDRALELYPDNVPIRAFRGVLRAVQGRREEALRDAQETRWRDGSPATLYQLAGLYATTSRQAPEDRDEAYRLLFQALRQGYGFELIDGDHELDPIRNQPEFRRVVDSARLARAPGPRPPARP